MASKKTAAKKTPAKKAAAKADKPKADKPKADKKAKSVAAKDAKAAKPKKAAKTEKVKVEKVKPAKAKVGKVAKPKAAAKPKTPKKKADATPEERWDEPTVIDRAPAHDPPLSPLVPEAAETHRFTGAPLLPRDRTSGPTKRTPRPEAPVAEPTVAPPVAVAAPIVMPPRQPANDSFWGALTPRAPTEAQTAAAAFWAQDARPWTPPARSPSAPPTQMPSAPVEGGAQNFQGQPGEGRRRRRRRRRGRGGPEGQPGGPATNGQPSWRDEPPPSDPLLRRLRRQFNLRDFLPGQ
jgi:hypothetical protein